MSISEKIKEAMKRNYYDVLIYNIETGEVKTKYEFIPNIVIAWIIAQYAMNFDRKNPVLSNELVFISGGSNIGLKENHPLYDYAKNMARKYKVEN